MIPRDEFYRGPSEIYLDFDVKPTQFTKEYHIYSNHEPTIEPRYTPKSLKSQHRYKALFAEQIRIFPQYYLDWVCCMFIYIINLLRNDTNLLAKQ